jgi:hypothetical protein
VDASDWRGEAIFRRRIGAAYRYDQAARDYVMAQSYEAGKGYWVRYDSTRGEGMAGFPILAWTQRADSVGWALVGGLGTPIPAAAISTIPAGSISTSPFRYNRNSQDYEIADTLQPGDGHWVYVAQPCDINLSAGLADPLQRKSALAVSGVLALRDSLGRVARAYIVEGDGTSRLIQGPPPPPDRPFTISVSHAGEGKNPSEGQAEVEIRGGAYPLSLGFEGSPGRRIRVEANNNPQINVELRSDTRLVIPSGVTRLRIRAGTLGSAQVPSHYALHQSYPNPFNSEATITFDLPEVQWTSLKVYTVLGEEVATLVDGLEPAGRRNVRFSAGNFASGVYIYRLIAGGFQESRKMLLVR